MKFSVRVMRRLAQYSAQRHWTVATDNAYGRIELERLSSGRGIRSYRCDKDRAGGPVHLPYEPRAALPLMFALYFAEQAAPKLT
jgi:hypothetical protein